MRAMLIALMVCVCGGALAWELPATRRAMMMDAMTPPASGGGTLGQGLIVHYKMNDSAGDTVVVDSKASFNGTSGRNTSIISVSGKIGSAFKFDGTNDAVRTLYFGCGANTSRTTAAWFMLDNTTKAEAGWYHGQNGVAAGRVWSITWQWAAFAGAGPGITAATYDGGSTTISPFAISTQTWHHIALTHTGTNQYLWIDGSNVANSAHVPLTTKLIDELSIGSYYVGESEAGLRFQGLIDDFRYYDRALNTNEILQLYNGGAGTEDE